jgi:hypothetical protein
MSPKPYTSTFAGTAANGRHLPLVRLFLAIFGALLVSLALHTSHAFAERTYDSHITGVREPRSIATDASDDVWVYGRGGLSEFSSYPSQTKIGPPLTEEGLECGGDSSCISSIGVDGVNESVFIGGNYGTVEEFGPTGEFIPPPWDIEEGRGAIAVDNSGGPANGVIYRMVNIYHIPERPEDVTVRAFLPDLEPFDFPASEPYIKGNRIIGTPSGNFGREGGEIGSEISGPVIGPNGVIYLLNNSVPVLYEYKSSGEFIGEVPIAESGYFIVDPVLGNILITNFGNTFNHSSNRITEYSPTGEFLGEITEANGRPFGEIQGMAFDSEGHLYVSDNRYNVVDIFTPKVVVPKVSYEEVFPTSPTEGTLNAVVDPNGGGEVTSCEFEYGTSTAFELGTVPCSPSAPYSAAQPHTVSASLSGLTTNTTYYYRAVVANHNASKVYGKTRSYTPRWVQGLRTEAATEAADKSAVLNGSFVGNEEDTHYYFEFGSDLSYGAKVPALPGNDAGTGSLGVRLHVAPVTVGELQPGVTYHYRIVASNAKGTTYGADETFTTLTKPSIESLSTSDLSATTVDLHATINPKGGDTSYYFEYGVSSTYGGYAPAPPPGEDIGESQEPQKLEAHLEGLQGGATYHFRVIAENPYGRSVSEDQAFSFHPPSCPNSHLRQITRASYLPDCRAYELVSPAYAGGASLFPEGPYSPQATSPSRLAYGGVVGTVPSAGDPPNTLGDLYVATRTDQGWVSKYVGFPASQALILNGPPNEANSGKYWLFNILTAPAGVRADASLDKFADWKDGGGGLSGGGGEAPFEYTPYLWGADGASLGKWPTDPGYKAGPVFEQSADFSHFVFQTGEAPELSIIDNETESGSSTVVSLQPNGEAIELEPTDTEPNYESLRIPAVSENGSRILMSVRGAGQELCGSDSEPLKCELAPGHLYMRVNDMVTYDVSEGHIVSYVGMTPDGSKVYFTSAEKLTPEDKDTSTDLYMWSEEKAEHSEPALTLISKGDNAGNPGEPGSTDSCSASWIAKCDVATYVNDGYSQTGAYGGFLGNGHSDNLIAADAGDIYFFSPEQLDHGRGVDGQENMYDYREGRVQYVTTLSPKAFCLRQPENESLPEYCSVGPVARMQVTPTDSRMAFETADKITPYNNTGHLEMYIYDPAAEELRCVSCRPDGEPPSSNVTASSNGIFMTNDGRVFFSTADPLVSQDTDGLRDVYEYTEGHAQLISSGVSSKDRSSGLILNFDIDLFTAGLVGVSANGTDAYFTTYDTLVGQDENGTQLKFYDARTGGGFPNVPPPSPCEAADECHGAGSATPQSSSSPSGAKLGTGGNVPPKAGCKKGFVKRYGKCVAPHHHKHRRHHRRGGRGR